jgi:hypothetical protein
MDNRNGGEEAAIPSCASSAAQSDFERIPGLFKLNSGLDFPISGIERNVGAAELLLKCICG